MMEVSYLENVSVNFQKTYYQFTLNYYLISYKASINKFTLVLVQTNIL